MVVAVTVAILWWSPGKEDGQVKERHANSPIYVLYIDTVGAEEQAMLLPSVKNASPTTCSSDIFAAVVVPASGEGE